MANEKELKAYEGQLKDYEKELTKAQERVEQKESQINQYASQSYGNQNKQNLVEWELDFKPELEDIAHSLKCDVIIIKDGKTYQLGKFESEVEAAVAYDNAAREHFGEFACMNF